MAAFVSTWAGVPVRPRSTSCTRILSPRPSAPIPARRPTAALCMGGGSAAEETPSPALYEDHFSGPLLHHAPHIVLHRSGEGAVIVDMAEVALPATSGGADADTPDAGAYEAHYPAAGWPLHVAPHITFDGVAGVGVEMKAVDVPRAPPRASAHAYPPERLHQAPHISLHDKGLVKVEMRPVATRTAAADRPSFDDEEYGKYGGLNRAPVITFPADGAEGALGVRVAMEAVSGDGKLNAAPVITFDGTHRVGVSMPLIQAPPASPAHARGGDSAPRTQGVTSKWLPASKFAKSWV